MSRVPCLALYIPPRFSEIIDSLASREVYVLIPQGEMTPPPPPPPLPPPPTRTDPELLARRSFSLSKASLLRRGKYSQLLSSIFST